MLIDYGDTHMLLSYFDTVSRTLIAGSVSVFLAFQ